jgi:hypothetical protein
MFRLKLMLGELDIEKYSGYYGRGVNARHLHCHFVNGFVYPIFGFISISGTASTVDVIQFQEFTVEFDLCIPWFFGT